MDDIKNQDIMASLESKSKLLTNLIKKRPFDGKPHSINVAVVLSMAIKDPLIFLNVIEQILVSHLSKWRMNDSRNASTILENIINIVSRLCKFKSCNERVQFLRLVTI